MIVRNKELNFVRVEEAARPEFLSFNRALGRARKLSLGVLLLWV